MTSKSTLQGTPRPRQSSRLRHFSPSLSSRSTCSCSSVLLCAMFPCYATSEEISKNIVAIKWIRCAQMLHRRCSGIILTREIENHLAHQAEEEAETCRECEACSKRSSRRLLASEEQEGRVNVQTASATHPSQSFRRRCRRRILHQNSWSPSQYFLLPDLQ